MYHTIQYNKKLVLKSTYVKFDFEWTDDGHRNHSKNEVIYNNLLPVIIILLVLKLSVHKPIQIFHSFSWRVCLFYVISFSNFGNRLILYKTHTAHMSFCMDEIKSKYICNKLFNISDHDLAITPTNTNATYLLIACTTLNSWHLLKLLMLYFSKQIDGVRISQGYCQVMFRIM